jgi:plasmid stabilization system protein ParE
MSRSILLRPDAEEYLATGKDWYDRQKSGLGERFLQATSMTFEHIADSPEQHAKVHDEVRRVTMRRFPYVVYYIASADAVEIIGVLHGARHPRVWQSRIE